MKYLGNFDHVTGTATRKRSEMECRLIQHRRRLGLSKLRHSSASVCPTSTELCFIAQRHTLGSQTHYQCCVHALYSLQFMHQSILSRTLRKYTGNMSPLIVQISKTEVTHPASTRTPRMCFQQLVYCTEHHDLCSRIRFRQLETHLRSTMIVDASLVT